MPLVLMQANGACIHLTPDKGFRLGRQQVAPSFGGAAHVSRQLTQSPAAYVKISLQISLTQLLQCKGYSMPPQGAMRGIIRSFWQASLSFAHQQE